MQSQRSQSSDRFPIAKCIARDAACSLITLRGNARSGVPSHGRRSRIRDSWWCGQLVVDRVGAGYPGLGEGTDLLVASANGV